MCSDIVFDEKGLEFVSIWGHALIGIYTFSLDSLNSISVEVVAEGRALTES